VTEELADHAYLQLRERHPELLDRLLKAAQEVAPGLTQDHVRVIFRRACAKAIRDMAEGQTHEDACQSRTQDAVNEIVQFLCTQEQAKATFN